MINTKYTYAIIGASNNKEKYGYKIFDDMIKKGYKTIPINPNEKNTILGHKTYPNISIFKGKIDVVIFVVPPKITYQVLQEAKQIGIKNVWMQPGSESEEAIVFCQKNNINYITNSCIMLQKNNQN